MNSYSPLVCVFNLSLSGSWPSWQLAKKTNLRLHITPAVWQDLWMRNISDYCEVRWQICEIYGEKRSEWDGKARKWVRMFNGERECQGEVRSVYSLSGCARFGRDVERNKIRRTRLLIARHSESRLSCDSKCVALWAKELFFVAARGLIMRLGREIYLATELEWE